MVAERIQVASSKTGVVVARSRAQGTVSTEKRQALEDCGLAIALAMASLVDLKAAKDARWCVAARDMKRCWASMEAAVRLVTGESAESSSSATDDRCPACS